MLTTRAKLAIEMQICLFHRPNRKLEGERRVESKLHNQVW